MTQSMGLSAQWTELMNQLAARRAAFAQPATGFLSQPEPRTIGVFARGKQMIAGNIHLAGHLIEAPGLSLWDISMPDAAFAAEAHGFRWLDDLAAVGDHNARHLAQDWTWDWITRYGKGRGPGWSPDLTGRRLIRWINHAFLLLNGRERGRHAGLLSHAVAANRVPFAALESRCPRTCRGSRR